MCLELPLRLASGEISFREDQRCAHLDARGADILHTKEQTVHLRDYLMQRRTRLILLFAIVVCLVPVAVIVNRKTSLSEADILRRVASEDRAFLDVKLPKNVVPGFGMPPRENHKKEYRFRTDWFSKSIPVWEQVLAEFKGKPDVHYLEIGLFEGRSALWVLDNILTDPTSKLTGIDLFQDGPGAEGLKDVFFSNFKLSGQEDRSTILTGFSQVELRKLQPDSFDIIYIDGSHAAGDVLEDAVLSHRLLKKNGMLIFDDYLWGFDGPAHDRPKPAIDTFYAFFRDHYDVVHNGYQVMPRRKP